MTLQEQLEELKKIKNAPRYNEEQRLAVKDLLSRPKQPSVGLTGVDEWEKGLAEFYNKVAEVSKLAEGGGYIAPDADLLKTGENLVRQFDGVRSAVVQNLGYLKDPKAVSEFLRTDYSDLQTAVGVLRELNDYYSEFADESDYSTQMANGQRAFLTERDLAKAYNVDEGSNKIAELENNRGQVARASDFAKDVESNMIFKENDEIDWDAMAASGKHGIYTENGYRTDISGDQLKADYLRALDLAGMDYASYDQYVQDEKNYHDYMTWAKKDFEYLDLLDKPDFYSIVSNGEAKAKENGDEPSGKRVNEMYKLEKDIWHYLYVTDSKEAADAYVEHLQRKLKEYRADSITRWIEGRRFNGAAATLFNLATRGLIDTRNLAEIFTDLDSSVWEDVNKNLQNSNKLTKTDKWFHQAGGVIGSQLPEMGLNKIAPGLGRVYQALHTYGASEREAREMGLSKSRQIAYGAATAAGQYAVDKGLDKFFGGVGVSGKVDAKIDLIQNKLWRAAAKTGARITSENIEELTEAILLEPTVNYLFTDQAFEMPGWDEIADTVAITTLSTFLLSAGTITADEIKTQNQYDSIGKKLIGSVSVADLKKSVESYKGSMSDADFKAAQKLASKIADTEDGLSQKGQDGMVGQLYTILKKSESGSTASADKIDIKNRLRDKDALGDDVFDDETASAIADALVASRNGQELSRDQQKVLKKYGDDSRVEKVINSLWGDGEAKLGQKTPVSDAYRTSAKINKLKALGLSTDAAKKMASGDTEGALKSMALSTGRVSVKSVGTDGTVTINGKTTSVADADFKSEVQRNAYAMVMGAKNMTPEGANLILGVRANMNGRDIEAALKVYQRGVAGEPIGDVNTTLSKAHIEAIHKAGMRVHSEGVYTAEQKVKNIYDRAAKALEKSGEKVTGSLMADEGVDISKLTGTEKKVSDLAAEIAPSLSVDIALYRDNDSQAMGFYDYDTDTIYLNVASKVDLTTRNGKETAMAFTLGHELLHRARVGDPKGYDSFVKFLLSEYGKAGMDVEEMIGEQIALSNAHDKTLPESKRVNMTREIAIEEIAAEACSRMLIDTDAGKKLAAWGQQSKANADFLQKLKQMLQKLINRLRTALTGADPGSEAAKAFMQLDKKVQQLLSDMFVDMSTTSAERLGTIKSANMLNEINTTNKGGVRYEIREVGNTGKFYVQADRQVITGDDASLWGKQIENYINEQIRKEQDVAIPTSDGHVLLLTGRSAYKLSDQAVSAIGNKIRNMLSTEKFALKGRAATHIDELIQVARYEDYKPDKNRKHENDIGEDGFRYYYSFFRDFDGQYYRVPFSAGVNDQEETAYSIGDIIKRRLPAGLGSSSNEALENGRKPSSDIIYTSGSESQEVKTAIQLAYEKALKKKGNNEEASKNHPGSLEEDQNPYLAERQDLADESESATEQSASKENSTEYKINTSMTMAEAKRMIETAYKVNGIAEYYEGEYTDAEDWLRKAGADEVEMYIENDYDLQAKYINSNEDILNEEYRMSDILEAYLAGTLVGKEKPKPKRLDVSQSTKLNDSRFYSPQKIEDARTVYDLAIQKAVGKDSVAVNQARAKILLFAHNKGAAELLGITQSELNKKLRSWSNYSATAREISTKINAGVAEENRWTGIENSAYISKASVTNEDIERMVASVEGDSKGYERKYIARVMLAADTHIDYSGLKFKFASSQQVNADNNSGGRVLGFYDDTNRLIDVTHDKPNTVAHEMGHYIDAQWGRDLIGTNSSHLFLTRGVNADMVRARYGDPGVQFLNNFKLFINSLSDVNQNYNSYYNDRSEIFARFFARFIEWTDNIATGNKHYSYESTMYNDKFTQAQFVEFARLLQEKAMLDGIRVSSTTDSAQATDIRYRLAAGPDLSARTLLTDPTVEGKNQAQKLNLERYRDAVEKADGLETHLQDVKAQYDSMTDAQKKSAEGKELRAEINKTKNRLNMANEDVMKLEHSKPLQTVLKNVRSEIFRETAKAAENAIKASKEDIAIMEKEFVRIVKEYEKTTSKLGKKEDTISDLRATLKSEAKKHSADARDRERLWNQEFNRLLREYERSGKKIDTLEDKLAHEKEKAKEKTVSQKKKEAKAKILRTVKELEKLMAGTKKKNVKEDMKLFVHDAVSMAKLLFKDDYTNEDIFQSGIPLDLSYHEEQAYIKAKDIAEKIAGLSGYENLAERANLEKELKVLMNDLSDAFEKKRRTINRAIIGDALNKLVDDYRDLADSEYEYIKLAVSDNVANYIDLLIKENKGVRISDMTLEQLEAVGRAYTMVLSTIRTANKLFNSGKSAEDAATEMRETFLSHKETRSKSRVVAKHISNMWGWNYLRLYYALKRADNAVLTELYNKLADSENVIEQDVYEAFNYRNELLKQHKANKWSFNKKLDTVFLDTRGREFKLTLGEAMTLYLYGRRPDARSNLEEGGFQFGKHTLDDPNTEWTYRITEAQYKAVESALTEDQRKFADAMQKYLADVMGAKGNEVTMALYGVKLFNDPNYIPVKISGTFREDVREATAEAGEGFVRMKDAGFTHEKNKNARATVSLESFMELWTDHVCEMSAYHGAVLPLENVRKVMNYGFNNPDISVRGSMEAAIGKDGANYFNNIYNAVNGKSVRDKLEAKVNKRLSRFRKGKVAYSASVIVQQPTSITRAEALVKRRYFRGPWGVGRLGVAFVNTVAGRKTFLNAYDEMLKYAPGVTIAKEFGGYDVGTAGMRSKLLDTYDSAFRKLRYGTAKEKAGAIMDMIDDNVIANIPAFMDKVTWVEIWHAVKNEQMDLHKGMDYKSDAFMKIVGNRFTEVIQATQVYDSIFAKSPLLNSKSGAIKFMTSFMAEANVKANMVTDAFRDIFVKRDVKAGLRTLFAVIRSNVFNSVAAALIYALRDDDEVETYAEKYLSNVFSGLIESNNPWNDYVFARDLWSLLKGYDVERPDMAVADELIDSISNYIRLTQKDIEDMNEKQLAEHEQKTNRALWDVIFKFGNSLGIPAGNIRREFDAIINTVTNDAGDTTSSGLREAIWDELRTAVPVPALYITERSTTDKLYDATMDGDSKYIERMKKRYVDDEGNFDQDKYDNALKKALQENDPRIKEAAQARLDHDLVTYGKIYNNMVAEGKFTDVVILKAITAEFNKIKPDAEKEKKEDPMLDVYGAAEYYFATLYNAENKDEIYDHLIDNKIADGMTEYEANQSVMTSIANELRDNDARIEEAATAYLADNYAEYSRIYDEILAEGNFSDEIVSKAVRSKINQLKPDEPTEPKDPDPYKSRFTADDYYKAIMGKSKSVDDIYNDLYQNAIADGKSDNEATKSVTSSIATALRNNDPRVNEAALAHLDGNVKKRVELANAMVKDGFSQNAVVAAVDSEINALSPNDSEDTAPKQKGWYRAEDVATSVIAGDSTTASKAFNDLVATNKANGKSPKEAKSAAQSSVKTALRDAYESGTLDRTKAINSMVTYCGMERDDAKADVIEWDYKEKNPNKDVESGWFDTYVDKVSSSGMPIETYVSYRNKTKNLKGDKDKNGKTISGSLKKKVLNAINSMPITSKQKDALYLAEGYPESKIHEAPWH